MGTKAPGKPSYAVLYSSPFSFPDNTAAGHAKRTEQEKAEVTHGYVILVKHLSEQLVFDKPDCASIL